MNIIYKHKETGETISLDKIKEQLDDYDSNPYFKLCISSNGCDLASYVYGYRDVPLSDDFELVIEDNPYDFDECDIYTLLNALKLYPYSTAHEEKLRDKLVKIYKKLKGWD